MNKRLIIGALIVSAIQFQPKESRKNYIENLAGAMFKIVLIAMFFSAMWSANCGRLLNGR
ncbi:MAG: hypothetical protein ACXQTS_03010 [Candidatus Methanospirareceae archaeon]